MYLCVVRPALLASLIVLAFPLLRPSHAHSDAASQRKARPFQVVAYLPDYRLATLNPAQLNGVTDLVYFSLEPTPVGGLNTPRLPPDALRKLHDLTRKSHTRLLVAL